jgi:alkanesulfonate monooxygenase SsuD/methylene tetrahydromethanopterin reductase-like flavin-dependent oxidoreductase (luciferase family)
MAVTFGCKLPAYRADVSPQAIRTLAQHAEALGFDSVWSANHIVVPREVSSAYPYAPGGAAVFRGRVTHSGRTGRADG